MKHILVAVPLVALGLAGQAPAHMGAPPARPAYTVAHVGSAWWLKAPNGRSFFSRGVCCVTTGVPFPEYSLANPGYAAWKEYPDPGAWADATVSRLKEWRFTTIGGWSDDATLKRSHKMDLPYTLVLHLGASAGAPWLDMWNPAVIAAMDDAARKQIVPVRNDPLLLGYYTDNELGWWNGALFTMALQEPAEAGQRSRLIALLQRNYHSSWPALLRDFVPAGAHDFASLAVKGTLTLRPGGSGIHVEREFLTLVADRYYALMRRLIRKYDPRGLLLGDRYQSFFYPEVAAAAGRCMDIVSSNINPNWTDGSLVRYFLPTLHALCRKPIMVGEFYMAAAQNGSGDRNDSSGFPVVASQRERAAGFHRTLETFAATPYLVGADWFQFADEPGHGRGDGEDYDMGLVDVYDRPYHELTDASAALDADALHAEAHAPRVDAASGVPPAPADPMAHNGLMAAMAHWDRERGFVPPSSEQAVADMYACWSADALYLGLSAMDPAEPGYYAGKKIPEEDRLEWSIRLPGHVAPVRIRLGARRPPSVSGAVITVVDGSGQDRDVRTIAIARIPAALLGERALSAGDAVGISSAVTTLARARSIGWRGAYRLASGP